MGMKCKKNKGKVKNAKKATRTDSEFRIANAVVTESAQEQEVKLFGAMCRRCSGGSLRLPLYG